MVCILRITNQKITIQKILIHGNFELDALPDYF